RGEIDLVQGPGALRLNLLKGQDTRQRTGAPDRGRDDRSRLRQSDSKLAQLAEPDVRGKVGGLDHAFVAKCIQRQRQVFDRDRRDLDVALLANVVTLGTSDICVLRVQQPDACTVGSQHLAGYAAYRTQCTGEIGGTRGSESGKA